MVRVEMHIATTPYEFTGTHVDNLGNYHRKQCIACDVERNAQEVVTAPLVQTAIQGEAALWQWTRVKLVEHVAWRQGHFIYLASVPRVHDESAGVRIGAKFVDHPGELINGRSIGTFPASPLLTVDRPEITVLVGPLVPDTDTVLFEELDVGVTTNEP